MSVFQEIAGRVYSVSNGVQSYLNLKSTNADLMQRIAVLEEDVQGYKNQIKNFTDRMQPDTIRLGVNQINFHLTPARVTHNEILGSNNYILLDKGSNDSIAEDMAVVSVKGIVGVVETVTPHYSRVRPVINSGYNPSCMIKNTRFFGSLFWDGKDPRFVFLNGLPSHALYNIGDTIVTSGFSGTFPEGVLVGVVEDAFKRKNEEYNSLKVRLFTDFSTLNEVLVIKNLLRDEQLKIEKGVSVAE